MSENSIRESHMTKLKILGLSCRDTRMHKHV